MSPLHRVYSLSPRSEAEFEAMFGSEPVVLIARGLSEPPSCRRAGGLQLHTVNIDTLISVSGGSELYVFVNKGQ